jgi:hypothetical protein
MVAALDQPIGWGALRTVVERLQKTRCPTVNRVDAHAVLEVVLGNRLKSSVYELQIGWMPNRGPELSNMGA